MIEIKLNGKVVSRSKNLRCVLRYAAKNRIVIAAWFDKSQTNLGYNSAWFSFIDGAYCTCPYESKDVFDYFVQQRRSWGKIMRFETESSLVFSNIFREYITQDE